MLFAQKPSEIGRNTMPQSGGLLPCVLNLSDLLIRCFQIGLIITHFYIDCDIFGVPTKGVKGNACECQEHGHNVFALNISRITDGPKPKNYLGLVGDFIKENPGP